MEQEDAMTPDITMCKGAGCPVRENCYRYKAEPSEYQSYFVEDFPCKNARDNQFGQYFYFWDNRDEEEK